MEKALDVGYYEKYPGDDRLHLTARFESVLDAMRFRDTQRSMGYECKIVKRTVSGKLKEIK